MMISEENWELEPIAGATGNTFYGTLDHQEIFLKRNSSPLLAAVAKEEIAPKLLWSRRDYNGDTLSAQEWIKGGVLSADMMQTRKINDVLQKLHASDSLVASFKKMGNHEYSPYKLLENCLHDKQAYLDADKYLNEIVNQMKQTYPLFDETKAVVVHGDVNHKNWIRDNNDRIYLVDWETAMLADELVDVSYILSHYIDKKDWEDWLVYSGYEINSNLMSSVKWYGQLSFLKQIVHHLDDGDSYRVNREIYGLKKFSQIFTNQLDI